MDIEEFEKRMDDALGEVKHLLVQSGYYDNQTLENIDCDRDDPDDVQRWNELTNTSKLLLKAVDDLNYLHRPIAGTSRLYLDTSGRYEEDFNEYTSGSGIEFLLADDCSKPCWVRSRVEVDDDGNYYIVGHRFDSVVRRITVGLQVAREALKHSDRVTYYVIRLFPIHRLGL